jgi:hypothetical protein
MQWVLMQWVEGTCTWRVNCRRSQTWHAHVNLYRTRALRCLAVKLEASKGTTSMCS